MSSFFLSGRMRGSVRMNKTRKKVLLVDDEPSVSSSLCDLLELWGYEVCDPVTTGEAAVSSTVSEKPDLVLMDIQLKGPMNGIESAMEIKKHNSAPIIFMTGYVNDRPRKEAEILRPAAYLTKPLELDELRSVQESASHAQ